MADKRVDWLLENLLESGTLTETEHDIVTSIANFYHRRGYVTTGQLDLLEEIYEKDNVRK